jgi:hypothetical protein
MVTTLHVPGRLILAGGFAVAMAIAPAVGALAGISSQAVSVTANPNQYCTVVAHNGSNSLVCTPPSVAADPNLPTEMGLTGQNAVQHH